jgi:M6 family metalloprotease-like protein
MKNIKKIILLASLTFFFGISVHGAYLRNVPINIIQPNGIEIICFATGDEFYNWLHNEDGYTIVQNQDGYYCYAILVEGELIASRYIVGEAIPASSGLVPYTNISSEKIWEKVKQFWEEYGENPVPEHKSIKGYINNIVIYIRFADQTEFSPQQSTYTSMFNTVTNSMRNYFKEISYNQLDILSYFYPIPQTNIGVNILSYQDSYPRSYYCRQSATNPNGYTGGDDGQERKDREHTLLYNAINYVKNQNPTIPAFLDVDYDNDGKVDNICFIIRGGGEAWNSLLWPHQWWLTSYNIDINGKGVYPYNVQLEDILVTPQYQPRGTGVLCHEMYHSLGAPDLYHYNRDGMDPVGTWDLMGNVLNPPQHVGAYMKYKYGGWISSIPQISRGTYTLQPLTSFSNNCYKIPIQNSSQYLVVEYRKKTGTFESSLPGSGLIIYRINEYAHILGTGNSFAKGAGGKEDRVYVFRPDGKINPPNSKGDIINAYFSQIAGRTKFSNSTNPYCFTAPNGDYGNIYMKNIQENANGTLSFTVGICENNNVTLSNTNNLPAVTNAFTIQTQGAVIVKNTDNVVFEAGNEVILDPGFEIQLGGTLEIHIIDCVW